MKGPNLPDGYYPFNADFVGSIRDSPMDLGINHLKDLFSTEPVKATIARLLHLWHGIGDWCGISESVWLAGLDGEEHEYLTRGLIELADNGRVWLFELTSTETIIYPTFEFIRMFDEASGDSHL